MTVDHHSQAKVCGQVVMLQLPRVLNLTDTWRIQPRGENIRPSRRLLIVNTHNF